LCGDWQEPTGASIGPADERAQEISGDTELFAVVFDGTTPSRLVALSARR
jgi:hypothetical protein